MGEYLRSAISNWVANANDEGHHGETENPFVGQQIELKGRRLKVDKVIAEGGFGFVFRVRDIRNDGVFALKRIIAADKEAKREIENEIEVLTKLQPHPHVMKFITWGVIGKNIYLLLSEYCGCGSLKDVQIPIENSQQINRILYQTSLAIKQMHKLNIIHRDLKIENILFDNQGFVKLCDFGSATTNFYEPNHTWTPIQRSLVEDEMSRHTTPMYRPPEILDTYLHYPINTSMDIWAFGCLVYLVKFGRHPFEDSAKLRIINCNYSMPPNVANDDVHINIIRSCLKVDPRERAKIEDIISMLEKNFVDLIAACVKPRQITPTDQYPTPPINQVPVGPPGSAQPASISFSGFTRYLKDTSSKVMQSVQQNYRFKATKPGAANNAKPGAVEDLLNLGPESVNANKTPASKPPRPPPVRPPPARPPVPPPPTIEPAVEASEAEQEVRESSMSSQYSENVPIENGIESELPCPNGESSTFDGILLDVNGSDDVPVVNDGPTITNVDLLIDTSIGEPKILSPNSNVDLLNDLLSTPPATSENVHTQPLFQATSFANPDILFSSTSNTPLVQQSLHRNTSTPNLTKLDPLTQLGSFASTAASFTSPLQQPKPQQQQSLPRVASYSTFQATSTQVRPDYNRSYFSEAGSTTNNATPKVKGDEFEDLLQDFPKRPPRENSTKTMGELKKQELLKDGMSPQKLLVMEWKENKTRNIRALLSSLHTVVWEGCNWQPIGMHQLVSKADVKKMYRKACIAVHPDKAIGTPHCEMASLIFVELNDAWSEFDKQP